MSNEQDKGALALASQSKSKRWIRVFQLLYRLTDAEDLQKGPTKLLHLKGHINGDPVSTLGEMSDALKEAE